LDYKSINYAKKQIKWKVKKVWDEIVAATLESDRKYLDRSKVPKVGFETVNERTNFLMTSKEIVSDTIYNIYTFRSKAYKIMRESTGKRLGKKTRNSAGGEEVKGTITWQL